MLLVCSGEWHFCFSLLILCYIDFDQAVQLAVQPKAEQKASPAAETKASSSVEQKASPDSEQKVASVVEVEVKTSPEVEVAEDKSGQKAEVDTSSPKCIGPGCAKNAQPDSVYCGHDCILRHAAAAMKSISDVKEPKDKAPITKSTAKVTRADWNTFQKWKEM